MQPVYVVGSGMTKIGKYPERSLKTLGREAVTLALNDAGLSAQQLEAAYVANSMAGIVTGQESIRGQVILSEMGITRLPVINVENACASSSTAFHMAWLSVAAGLYETVLVLGVEKLFHPDRAITYRALASATDIEVGSSDAAKSSFLEESSQRLGDYLKQSGGTLRHVAAVAAKNHYHAGLNPFAQYGHPYTVDEILSAPPAADPLTRLMCAPISDGAAALILCSAAKARQFGQTQIRVAASVLLSSRGRDIEKPDVSAHGASLAYEASGIGPDEVSLAELHDTTAASELMLYEKLGFCTAGDGPSMVDKGDVRLGGRLPVNTSGGLISRGHPIGATGAAQICELVSQLRGVAGPRQVSGARVGLAHNGGGIVLDESAALCVHMLVAER